MIFSDMFVPPARTPIFTIYMPADADVQVSLLFTLLRAAYASAKRVQARRDVDAMMEQRYVARIQARNMPAAALYRLHQRHEYATIDRSANAL